MTRYKTPGFFRQGLFFQDRLFFLFQGKPQDPVYEKGGDKSIYYGAQEKVYGQAFYAGQEGKEEFRVLEGGYQGIQGLLHGTFYIHCYFLQPRVSY